MLTALVDGKKCGPLPGLKGFCPACGQPATAKCGELVMWHWSHKGRKHCDPWWENETEWHRAWKSCFDLEWREVVHEDGRTGERHVADVKTPNGTVLEFQNSPMSLEEMRSREAFYGDMVWIVNASTFLRQLTLGTTRLPDPRAPFLNDVHIALPGFFRPSTFKPGLTLQQLFPLSDIQAEIDAHHVGHFPLSWERARTVWLDATRPVFLDTGTALLELARYPYDGARGQLGARRVPLQTLVERYGGNLTSAMADTHPGIATP